MKDYKQEFIDLMNRIHEDGNDGLIPLVISEGLRECKAYDKDAPHGNVIYWTIMHLYK